MPDQPETKAGDPKTVIGKSNVDATKEVNKDLGQVVAFFYFAISIALALTFIGCIKGGFSAASTAVLWATGGLAVGTFAGFLFGIPKILQRGQGAAEPGQAKPTGAPNAEQSYRQQVNTNLTEISDWLTKIIVGLGLIHLKQSPAFITGKASVLAASLKAFDSTGDYQAFAVAVIVTFPAFGFLFGYLCTRLYLASAFARADLAAINSAQTTADATSGAVESLAESLKVLTAKVNQMGPTPASVSSLVTPVPVQTPAPPAPQIPHPVAAPSATPDLTQLLAQQNDVKENLLALARQYNDFQSNNRNERVQKRDKLSEQMALLLNAHRDIRDWVVQTAVKDGNNGLISGLASAINAEPEPADVARLQLVAQCAGFKHSKYKVATALGRLFDGRLASEGDVGSVLTILNKYDKGDTDDSLKRRIRQTLAQITQSTGKKIDLNPA